MRKIIALIIIGVACAGCASPSVTHLQMRATYPNILNPHPSIELEVVILK
jgi:hypothetical protein